MKCRSEISTHIYSTTNDTLQVGLSTYSFPWAIGIDGFEPMHKLTAFGLLNYAATQHVHVVQFGDNLPLHLLTAGEQTKLKEAKDLLALNVEVGTRRLQEDHILKYLSIAAFLQSPFLRVVIDDEAFHPSVSDVKDTLANLLPVLRDKNIMLAIENHDRFSAHTLTEIINDTDKDFVGICLDTANSIGAGEGINEILPVLAPYTVNVHIKDFTIKRVLHKMGFSIEGCAAGDGSLNIPYIIKYLKGYEKCCTATLEVWSNPLSTIEETIQQEQEWVQKSIQYLKTIIP